MALFTILLLSILSVALSAIPSTQHMKVVPCGATCLFRFCRNQGIAQDFSPSGRRIIFRDPMAASLPQICHETELIGQIIRVGESSVKAARDAAAPLKKISTYMPTGLGRKFARKFFRVTPITLPPFPGKFSVTRMPFRANQQMFFDDMCVVIPIKKYEVLNADGSVKKVVTSSRSLECLSFKTVDPNLHFELTWNTDDNLDLSVTEPSGATLSPTNLESATGRHNAKTNDDLCGLITVGREQVRYLRDPGADSGTYGISVSVKNKCSNKPIELVMSIYSEGKVLSSKSSMLGGSASGVAYTDSYDF